MAWYQIFYDVYENLKTRNKDKTEETMKDGKTKDDIKNPNFYSGSTYIGDWTGAYASSVGWGIKNYDAYFGTNETKETINNFKKSNIYKELANLHRK